jgi:hypothetical protein
VARFFFVFCFFLFLFFLFFCFFVFIPPILFHLSGSSLLISGIRSFVSHVHNVLFFDRYPGIAPCTGAVMRVLPMGAVALIDEGEVDWKVFAIDADDAHAVAEAARGATIEDLSPGTVAEMREWFRGMRAPRPFVTIPYFLQSLFFCFFFCFLFFFVFFFPPPTVNKTAEGKHVNSFGLGERLIGHDAAWEVVRSTHGHWAAKFADGVMEKGVVE